MLLHFKKHSSVCHTLATQLLLRGTSTTSAITRSCRSCSSNRNAMSFARKCLIVPGNGCGGGDFRDVNFYGWLAEELDENSNGLATSVLPGPYGMPDPLQARKHIWLPHINGEMGCDKNSVVIGHSSGAAAALCLAQQQEVAGIIIVAGYDDPMGDDLEAASGYFDEEFDWVKIQANAGFIIQFAGTRDRLVPIEVQRRLSQKLSPKVRYVELANRDHFFTPPFPELMQELLPVLQSLREEQVATEEDADASADILTDKSK